VLETRFGLKGFKSAIQISGLQIIAFLMLYCYPASWGCKIPKSPNDRLQGTLDLLILTAISRGGPLHGYAIAKYIREYSGDALRIEDGSLYPAIHRMTQQKWLKGEWGLTESKRPARIYTITALGHKQLEIEEDRWDQLTAAVSRVLQPT
jgi:PadR family transcriptional regulator, regulatory protein PadR